MPGEQETNAEIEPDVAPTIDEQVEAPEAEIETSEAEQQEPPEELEEFEWNGKKIQGPKGLKDGVLMHADYTRKTQETAQLRRELEQRAAALHQQFQVSEEEMQTRAALVGIEASIKAFEAYSDADWQRWTQDDPVAAQEGWRKYQQFKEARREASEWLGAQQHQRVAGSQQETAKRLAETREFAQRNIKGWSPEVDAKLTDFAMKELGFDTGTLLGAYNPQVYRALHLAWIGHQTLSKPTAGKPAAPPVPAMRVVAGRANAPAVKPLADMNMDEYAAHRRKQMANKR